MVPLKKPLKEPFYNIIIHIVTILAIITITTIITVVSIVTIVTMVIILTIITIVTITTILTITKIITIIATVTIIIYYPMRVRPSEVVFSHGIAGRPVRLAQGSFEFLDQEMMFFCCWIEI